MYLATANIQNTMSYDDRFAEAQRVFNGVPDAPDTVVCWQELKIDAVEDRHLAIIAAEPAGTQHCFRNLPIAASVPTGRYEVLEETYVQTVPAIDLWATHQYADPARYFGTLKLRAKFRQPPDKFYVINTHFPSGSNWNNPTPTAGELIARDRWNMHFQALKDEIARIKDPATINKTVMWTGDFNRGSTMPQFYPNEKQAFGQNSVDKAYVIDRTIATTKISDGIVDLLVSDHDCKWVDWRLTAA